MPTQDEQNVQEEVQQRNLSNREALGNAYAAIKAQENITTFAAFTLEDAIDLQIERIEGEGTPLRPNQLKRVERIKNNVVKAVAELKEMPPEMFEEIDEGEQVNTPVSTA